MTAKTTTAPSYRLKAVFAAEKLHRAPESIGVPRLLHRDRPRSVSGHIQHVGALLNSECRRTIEGAHNVGRKVYHLSTLVEKL
jgi:hypothetical protein